MCFTINGNEATLIAGDGNTYSIRFFNESEANVAQHLMNLQAYDAWDVHYTDAPYAEIEYR